MQGKLTLLYIFIQLLYILLYIIIKTLTLVEHVSFFHKTFPHTKLFFSFTFLFSHSTPFQLSLPPQISIIVYILLNITKLVFSSVSPFYITIYNIILLYCRYNLLLYNRKIQKLVLKYYIFINYFHVNCNDRFGMKK